MLKVSVFISLLFIFYHAQANNSCACSPTDSIGYVYEFDLKYVGSTSEIDLNYRYVLGHLIELLEKDPNLYVHVRGHVCCGPSLRLSKKRARKVYKLLKRSGIDKKRISYKGYSDTLPLVFPEKTKEDEIRNRRVDFVLYKYE